MEEEILSNFTQLVTDRYQQFMITDDVSENVDFCKRSKVKTELREYQRFPGEYLKTHRGLLLDHGLGAGKTKTAVQTMLVLGRPTVIMTPASLRGNFEKEMEGVIDPPEHYFLHYNAGNLVEQYNKIGTRNLFENQVENKFNGKLVIIEESHIFFQNVISGKATVAITIFQKLLDAADLKILCLTGTPITGDPFEIVPLFNVLRGYLRAGPGGKPHSLFPSLREEFYKSFVSEEFNSIKNKDIFQDRITGLVSYYKGILDPDHYIVPKVEPTEVIECPMGNRQWVDYLKGREQEWEYERFAKYKTSAFKESAYKKAERASAGTYKTSSAQACNFTFPEIVEKKYESQVSNYGKPKEISEFKWGLLTTVIDDPFKYVYENLSEYSGKLAWLIPRLISKVDMKLFVYTKFQVVGASIIGRMLEQAGFEQVTEQNVGAVKDKGRRFMVIDGNTKDPYKLINYYNLEMNKLGEYCQILIGTSVVQAGITLLEVQEGYCFEGQWRTSILTQVKGRMIRTCSHERLPLEYHRVNFYVLLAVPPKPELRSKISQDDGQTTDQMLYSLALRKSALAETFINAMREVAVDCYLNRAHNDISCRECVNEIPTALIPVDYKVHIVNGSKCTVLTKKTALKEYYDMESGERYHKDDSDNLYVWNEEYGTYEDIGFIKNGRIILREDF